MPTTALAESELLDLMPPPTPHVPLEDKVLSSHRTARGTNRYVRCSCGGFVILAVDHDGTRHPMAHAAGRAS